MKHLIVVDSFKGSMSSLEACKAIKRGIIKASPKSIIKTIPIGDGGEGTLESLMFSLDGTLIEIITKDPLGKDLVASYGILKEKSTAIMEIASATGLTLVSNEDRNPLKTSSYGSGLIVKDILNRGIRKIIIGLGGSATNDCGIGILSALGVLFKDKNNILLPPIGESLGKIHRIDSSTLDARLSEAEIILACDVANPLIGEKGATYTYSKQKGATVDMMKVLEDGMISFGELLRNHTGKDVRYVSGSGAAGGIAAGLMAFTNAKIVSGIEMMIEVTGLKHEVEKSDLVWTGEGRIDSQSSYGKVLSGIGRLCKEANRPCIALTGNIGEGADIMYKLGITSIFSIISEPCTLDKAIIDGYSNIESTAYNIAKLFSINDKG